MNLNPAEETNLSRELVSSKARVYRFSVIVEKTKTAILLSLSSCRDATHRAIHTRKLWKISGMRSVSM